MTTGPGSEFRGEAQPGEYYCFQIDVWAAREALKNLAVEVTDLHSEQSMVLGRDAITCFNLEVSDWLRRPMKRVDVAREQVQTLWFGVQMQGDATGAYTPTRVV